MTIREVKDILNARLHTPGADLDVQVHAACGSDMMSDVLAYVKDIGWRLSGLFISCCVCHPKIIGQFQLVDLEDSIILYIFVFRTKRTVSYTHLDVYKRQGMFQQPT